MHRCWQEINLSNDVSFIKIVYVVCNSRPERQYIVNTPHICLSFTYISIKGFNFRVFPTVSALYKPIYIHFVEMLGPAVINGNWVFLYPSHFSSTVLRPDFGFVKVSSFILINFYTVTSPSPPMQLIFPHYNQSKEIYD